MNSLQILYIISVSLLVLSFVLPLSFVLLLALLRFTSGHLLFRNYDASSISSSSLSTNGPLSMFKRRKNHQTKQQLIQSYHGNARQVNCNVKVVDLVSVFVVPHEALNAKSVFASDLRGAVECFAELLQWHPIILMPKMKLLILLNIERLMYKWYWLLFDFVCDFNVILLVYIIKYDFCSCALV